MGLLNRNDIINAHDARFLDVDVPEWGGTVRVQAMTGAEKDSFEASIANLRKNGNRMVTEPNLENVRAKLAARCLVDEEGDRLFTDDEVEILGRKSAAALDRVVEAAKMLNRMDNRDLAALEAGLKNGQPVV